MSNKPNSHTLNVWSALKRIINQVDWRDFEIPCASWFAEEKKQATESLSFLWKLYYYMLLCAIINLSLPGVLTFDTLYFICPESIG